MPVINGKHPADFVLDDEGRWHAVYTDGSLSPELTIDELMEMLPLLAEPDNPHPLTQRF